MSQISQRETLLKSYTARLKYDVKSILDNFVEIIKCAKVEEESQVARLTQAVEDQNEVQVRATNLVRAGESLLKLIAEMKEFLILNDFPSVNQCITDRNNEINNHKAETFSVLKEMHREVCNDLMELEIEYYR